MEASRNALISITDKSGIVDFATFLVEQGFALYATDGSAATLRQAGLAVTNISEVTAFPAIMDGRVKTLHPRIFGGILAKRDVPSHLAQAKTHEIPLFDLVVVNLYPFAETVATPDVTLETAIENIDIGGVALIRAAAKNHRDVAILVSPAQYAAVREEMAQNGGVISAATRAKLAVQAFATTADYDAQINGYFRGVYAGDEKFPQSLLLPFAKMQDLRYGENPHQGAALYRDLRTKHIGIPQARQLHGKELSFNNLTDADAAWHLSCAFERPAVAIIKHANPCGVAEADSLLAAYTGALATDSVSAFGGIIGVNRVLDVATAQKIAELFVEVIVAPGYSEEALRILTAKKNLRLLELPAPGAQNHEELEIRQILGGILLQDKDLQPTDDTRFEIVSKRQPTPAEWQAMLFGWKVVRWVKSNAVIFVGPDRTLGIGAGQMSRVDASQIAVEKAKKAGLNLQGSVVASDAFFPFADGVEAAAAAGATAVVQPGGSVRDQEVIAAADAHQMAMVLTHVRHFRH